MSNKIAMRLQADWPRDMSYDKRDPESEKFYSTVDGAINERTSIFYGRRQIDIFLLAMSLGYAEENRKKLRQPSRTIRRDALTEKEVWMMCSVALAEEKSLEVLADPPRVIRICEEYANGGMQTLISVNRRSGSASEPYEELIEEAMRGAQGA